MPGSAGLPVAPIGGSRRRSRGALRLATTAGLCGAGALGLAACSSSPPPSTLSSCPANAARLTVQGTGVATGTPDLLTVEVDISVTAPTAQAALAEDNEKATAVIAAFRAGGVTGANLQTNDLSVEPDYTSQNGTTVLAGYGVNDTVVAGLTDFLSAGSLLDHVSATGGNGAQIGSLSFSVKDPRTLEDQARTDAVHQAVSHAQAMAAAADETLGPICSLTDTTPTTQYPQAEAASGFAASGASEPVPLQAGSQQVSAQVSVVYALRTRASS